MKKMMTLFEQTWDDFKSGITVIIESNENAAHAYLYVNRELMSMVWLYNTSEAPDIPDWITGINYGSPCRNSSEYISPQLIIPEEPPYDLLIIANLHTSDNHQIEIGIIAPDGKSIKLLAILRDDQKCGWCNNAQKDSPVAKSLEATLVSGVNPSDYWKHESDVGKEHSDYRVLEMTKWDKT